MSAPHMIPLLLVVGTLTTASLINFITVILMIQAGSFFKIGIIKSQRCGLDCNVLYWQEQDPHHHSKSV